MNSILRITLLISFISCFCSDTYCQSNFKIILETDFDGNVIHGSKQELISEIRKGKPVRIGWQLDFDKDKKSDFDHWADAEFITILDNDVFTQIRNINFQIPRLEIPQIDIIPANTMWTAILGTNGLLKSRFIYEELEYEVDDEGNPIMTDELEKELAKREVRTWNVATFWVIKK